MSANISAARIEKPGGFAKLLRATRMPRLVVLPLYAVVAFLPSACAEMPQALLRQAQVEATNDANLGSATALDLVFVYKREAVSSLPKTGPDWFEEKSGIVAAYPSAFDVVSLQVPPGTNLKNVHLPARHGAAILIASYANYLSKEGQAVANLTSWKCVRIVLERERTIYAECR